MAMTSISNLVRHEGDPHVIRSGPSSLGMPDQLARMLGWFSIGLGLAQIFMPGRLTRWLGTEGSENLVRACGAREIGAGLLCLSIDKELGLWSRAAGDGLDLATLLPAMRESNPQSGNARMAAALVTGIMLLDVLAAQLVRGRHSEGNGLRRDYRDRSGFPKGIEAARLAVKSSKHNVPPLTTTHSPAS